MSAVRDLPTVEDLALLWEAVDSAEYATDDALYEAREAHARVLSYLMDSGVFERTATA